MKLPKVLANLGILSKMLMETEDMLFSLVHRLEPVEVRFLYGYAQLSRKLPVKALELLDSLLSMETYDRRSLEAKFTSLSMTRYHLRQLILRGLRAYREGTSIDSHIRSLILDFEILQEKGFPDEASGSLDRAEELAKRYGRLDRLIEIMQVRKLHLLEFETRELTELIAGQAATLRQVAVNYFQEIEMSNLYHQRFAAYREGGNPLVDPVGLLGKFSDFESKPETFHYRLHELQLERLVAQSEGDISSALHYSESIQALWKENPWQQQALPALYQRNLSEYLSLLLFEKNLTNAKLMVGSLEGIGPRNFKESAEFFQNTAHFRLLLLLQKPDKEEYLRFTEEIEAGLVKFREYINAARQFSIWFNLMLLCFIEEDYRRARRWIDMIISNKRGKIRKEIQSAARLLELVVYYELEIWDASGSAVIAAYRYFSRRDELGDFKREVLGHLSQLATSPPDSRRMIFESLATKLKELGSESLLPDHLGIHVVQAWAASKVDEKPIRWCLERLDRPIFGDLDIGVS